MKENIYPWQIPQWQQLIASKQQNHLPHALLFMGAQGLGKKHFAQFFARLLLCNKSIDVPCGQCQACHLMQAQSHPDFLLVEPEQIGGMIKIDQIREVVQFVNETALQSGRRIIIINPANAMNMNAANALLKTLEEPAPNTIIILICDQNIRLPATIKSRCQKIVFQAPTSQVALDWLQKDMGGEADYLRLLLNLSNGAPLKAKEFFLTEKEKSDDNQILALRQALYQGLILLSQRKSDPIQLASQLQDHNTIMLLNLLLTWLQDLLRFKVTEGEATFVNFDYHSTLAKLAENILNEKLLDYVDHVKKIYTHLLNSLNLNKQLLLEELFIAWAQYASC